MVRVGCRRQVVQAVKAEWNRSGSEAYDSRRHISASLMLFYSCTECQTAKHGQGVVKSDTSQ